MVKAEFKKSGKNKILTLSGNLTLEHAGELKQVFSNAIAKQKSVVIAFAQVDRVDFSFLQLLYSARQSAELKNITMVVNGPLPRPVQETTERAGFVHFPLATADGDSVEIR